VSDMDNPLMPRSAVISKIVDETHDTKTFTFEFTDGGSKGMEFVAGQFAMLSIFGYGEAAISIAQDPDDLSGLDLTVREVGSVTGALFRMKEGDTAGVRGPYGNGWPMEEALGKKLLVISGGCGCGTLRPVILAHMNDTSRFESVEILHGARTPGDIIYRRSYEEEWADTPNCSILLSSDTVPQGQAWSHKVGVVTTLFDEMKSTPDGTLVLMCGPEIMMKFVCLGLLERGFSEDQIYCSMERRMRCGVGFCGHCQLGSKYVCRDGPIFSFEELQRLPDHIVKGG
jgi:sulfhydrogenase subunit gamma (sulfur reductase)